MLGEPALRPVVLAQFVSLTGSHVTGLAVPTLAVLTLDAGPFGAALLFALGFGIRGIVGPFIGVLVDLAPSPRALLVGADLGHAVVVLAVPVGYAIDAMGMPLLLVVSALSGVLGAFTEIGVQASVPWLVPRERLVRANSALAGARAGGQVVGPGLAGVLVQLLGSATAMVADALSYLLSAALLRRLVVHRTPPLAPTPPAAASGEAAARAARSFRAVFVESFVAGGRVLRGRPVLIRIALAGAALNLGGAGIGGLYVLYAYRTLGLGPLTVALTVVVYSGVAILAVATAGPVAERLGLERTIILFAPAAGLALLLIPAAALAAPLVLLIVYEAVFGFCGTVWLIAATTLQQSLVPADSLGRVVALTRSVGTLAIPVGALAGGAIAEVVGLTATLTGFALVATAGTAAVLVRPSAYRAPTP